MSSERRPTGTENAASSADSPGDAGSPVFDGSTVVAGVRSVGRRLERWVRGSAMYGWLTAEPDPDVIVIDLRETWTVGPFLRVLDRVVDLFVDASRGSRVVTGGKRGVDAAVDAPLRVGGVAAAAFGLVVAVAALPGEVSVTILAGGLALSVAGLVVARDTRDWATLRETRPVQLAIAAFEPPEPPAREGDATPGDDATGGEDVDDADDGTDTDDGRDERTGSDGRSERTESDGRNESAEGDGDDPAAEESGRSLESVLERDPERSGDDDRTGRTDR